MHFLCSPIRHEIPEKLPSPGRPPDPDSGPAPGSVVDPVPKGSETFYRIRIRLIGLDPDPEPKGSECKFYVVKLDCYALKIKFYL